MRVSIIIPFHDGEAFLQDCLDSLAAMQYSDYEVLLVADHYKGDIKALTQAYTGKLNIRTFELNGERRGVAAARNVGLENAEGEFVYFLDSDDYIFDEAIEVLVETALESEEDVVYGKKHSTYYKRSIFLPTYIEKREQLIAQREALAAESEDAEAEDDEDENDASDEAADETQAEELSEEELERRAESRRLKSRRKAIKRLITRKKRFRNITVLHMLIRREVIERYGLRFDESLKYYSDIPFVAGLFDADIKIRKRYHSHYIKRKHSDPVNMPSLTQIADDGRFDEMIRMFRIAQDAVEQEGTVRRAIDHQIIVYYTDYFIKKLKRSENEHWRKERFEIMRELAGHILKANIRREKLYRRRMVRALLKGKLDKCIRLINRRLGIKKFKKMLKNRTVLAKHLYRSRYLKKPIEQNTILFESFFGKNYSDSPKYIYEYLAKNHPGKYKFVWVLDNDTKLPYGGIKVKRFSIKYMYYLACSKYFVFNGRQPVWFKKRKDTVFLETWHGTPLKKLVFDLDEVYSASPLYKKEVYKQSRQWDYLIAANGFSSRVFRSCFMYDKCMLEYGYPRNDILHAENRDELAGEIRQKLGIPGDKKTILYAPTWRDDEYYGKGSYKFELKLDLRKLRAELGEEYVVLLRTHYFISDALDTTGLEGFAYNLSKYNDISELYLISDIIITDYSSVFFDYANLKRPMLFFTYDLEKYRDVLRGFYIDIEEELPGPLLYTNDEVVAAIKNISEVEKKYAGKYEVFYEKYCGWEDGRASENVVKEVFKT